MQWKKADRKRGGGTIGQSQRVREKERVEGRRKRKLEIILESGRDRR